MFKDNEISQILEKITEGNSLLKSVLPDEVYKCKGTNFKAISLHIFYKIVI